MTKDSKYPAKSALNREPNMLSMSNFQPNLEIAETENRISEI
jgi:hypothetical protein